MDVHKRGIVHCDLKEANILITFNKQHQYDPLKASLPLQFILADFGVSKSIEDILTKKVSASSGTPRYMAPEAFYTKGGKNIIEEPEKLDVFSLGVMMFHLIFKHYPFSPSSFEDQTHCKDPHFVASFVSSDRNTHRTQPSSEFIDLL